MPKITDAKPRVRPVPAVSRAVAILRALGQFDTPVGVQTLSKQLDLIPSTCLHILRQLVVEDLVTFDEGARKYSLSPGILGLADKMLRRAPMAHNIQPSLDSLSRKMPISAALMQIADEENMVVIGVSKRPEPGIKVELGTLLSPFMSATGRCVAGLNKYSLRQLRSRFSPLKWANPPSFDRWKEECKLAQLNGYGIDYGNYSVGITVISVPIFNAAGDISHAVIAYGLSAQVEQIGIESIVKELKAIAIPFSIGSNGFPENA